MWRHRILLALVVALPIGVTAGFASDPPTKSASGAPGRSIPGLIEAEDFDTGGEGVGYHDATPGNSGGVGRHDDVDLSACSEGGFTVTDLAPGEWLRYTVDVESTDVYSVVARVARGVGSDSHLRIACDGADITGAITVPNTGGPQHWLTLSRPGVRLTAGTHTLVVTLLDGMPLDLDWIRFTKEAPPTPGPRPNPREWTLIWSDEFEYSGKPDPAKWGYETGGGGWGNHELQHYTDRLENARVDGGKLVIEARRERHGDRQYTSARLVTSGKRTFRYGRVEVSAKLPRGVGTWPAIWMLGASNYEWPARGELDIMEHVGKNPGWIHASAHCQKYYWRNGNQKTSITYIGDAQSAFHEYAMEWSSDRLDFFVDNNEYLTVTNERTGHDAWPFDDPEYLLLNIAVGGDWGGPAVDDSAFPVRMEIDYVRVYDRTTPLPHD
jgi:beta-glucanase (GH16 family)